MFDDLLQCQNRNFKNLSFKCVKYWQAHAQQTRVIPRHRHLQAGNVDHVLPSNAWRHSTWHLLLSAMLMFVCFIRLANFRWREYLCKFLIGANVYSKQQQLHRFRFDEITSPPAVILSRWWTGDESICHSFLKNWVSRPHFILRKCTEILVNNTGSNFSANESDRAATTPVGVWSSSKCRLEWLFASIERAPQEARLSFVHSFVVSITRDTVKRLECGAVRRRLNRERANIFAFNRQQRTPHLITHYVSVTLLFFATNCFK